MNRFDRFQLFLKSMSDVVGMLILGCVFILCAIGIGEGLKNLYREFPYIFGVLVVLAIFAWCSWIRYGHLKARHERLHSNGRG